MLPIKKQKKRRQIAASTFNLKKVEDAIEEIIKDVTSCEKIEEVLKKDGFMIFFIEAVNDDLVVKQIGANIDRELVLTGIVSAMKKFYVDNKISNSAIS